MLTRLRIQGFKNLVDITVRFGPFTCIAGLNAAGKSNLFDAIRFLHQLTQQPIMDAVGALRDVRGRAPAPSELFTRFGDYTAPEIRFTADLVVDRDVEDEFGVKAKAAISTLTYVVAFKMSPSEPGILELAYEELKASPLGNAKKFMGFPCSKTFLNSAVRGRRTTLFISTSESSDDSEKTPGPVITVHQEGHGGRKLPAPKSTRTVAGGLANSDFPTILAVNREMAKWKSMLLEPSAMRSPSTYREASDIDARGANLPNTIYRLERFSRGARQSDGGKVGATLANRLSRLVEDITDVKVVEDEKFETRILQVKGSDGVYRPAHALSDGTLRFLVLCVLEQDPHAKGVICLEEPENGIHQSRIPAIIDLLQDIAVDTELATGPDNPLRQVIINTHSPLVVNQILKDDLVYIECERRKFENAVGNAAVAFVPKGSWRSKAEPDTAFLAPGQIAHDLGEGCSPSPLGQTVFEWANSSREES